MAQAAAAASTVSSNDENGMLSDCRLVWLDANINSDGNQKVLDRLRRFDPNIRSFTDDDECLDYFKKENKTKKMPFIFFIVSGAYSREILPQISRYPCIYVVYIFCYEKDKYADIECDKLQAICTKRKELIMQIENCLAQSAVNVDFSLYDKHSSTQTDSRPSDVTVEQHAIRNVKTEHSRFLWFFQLAHFLAKSHGDDNEQAKKEMIDHCRQQYTEDGPEQIKIDEFEAESIEENREQVILWYTSQTFIFKCLNTMLRTENIAGFYSYRYFIRLLCRELNKEHRRFVKENANTIGVPTTFRVYRGQKLEFEDIELLANHTGSLISLNGFVSTTRDRNMAIKFSRLRRKCGNFKRVLFEIEVNMNEPYNTPFADISGKSAFPHEQEVLFTIGTVFRIESVEFTDDNNKTYLIRLSLSSHERLGINNYIEQTYAKQIVSENQMLIFGQLLLDMGEFVTAIKYLNDLRPRLSDDQDRLATCLNNIGVCYGEMGAQEDALRYYEKAAKIYDQTGNRRGLGSCEHNMAAIYYARNDFNRALQCALRARDTKQQHDLEKASTLDILGCIYLGKSEVDTASDYIQQALQLRTNHFGQINMDHPDLGKSFNNLGKVRSRQSLPFDAKENYLKAARIFRQNYPPTHQLVIEVTKNLEEIERRLNPS